MQDSLITLITTVGYIGVFVMVFAESGLLIGAFLPGDTLLFTAGFLASQGYFNIALLVVGSFLAAVVGDSIGYWFGKKYGPKVFVRPKSLFFKPEYVERTQVFFGKHGKKTIVLARYVPIVRTFAPIFSGVGGMKYRSFLFYNILGGLAWTVSILLLGYFLGREIPNVDAYVLPIVLIIFVASVLPVAARVIRERFSRID